MLIPIELATQRSACASSAASDPGSAQKGSSKTAKVSARRLPMLATTIIHTSAQSLVDRRTCPCEQLMQTH